MNTSYGEEEEYETLLCQFLEFCYVTVTIQVTVNLYIDSSASIQTADLLPNEKSWTLIS